MRAQAVGHSLGRIRRLEATRANIRSRRMSGRCSDNERIRIDAPQATFEAGPEGTVYLPGVLQAAFGQSGSHWRRQIDQGGIRLNGEPAAGYEHAPAKLEGAVLQAGKRQFVRLHSA